jgi:hypothetical protein
MKKRKKKWNAVITCEKIVSNIVAQRFYILRQNVNEKSLD